MASVTVHSDIIKIRLSINTNSLSEMGISDMLSVRAMADRERVGKREKFGVLIDVVCIWLMAKYIRLPPRNPLPITDHLNFSFLPDCRDVSIWPIC